MNALLGLIGLPSPAVLLGVLMALAAVGSAAYHEGHVNGFNAAEAARAASQDKAIDALDKQLTATRESAISLASAQGVAIAESDKSKAALNQALKDLRDAKNRPPVSCVSPEWMRDVNAAVSAANQPLHPSNDTGIVPIRMPAVANSGLGLKRMDGGSDLGGRGVSAAASGMPGVK